MPSDTLTQDTRRGRRGGAWQYLALTGCALLSLAMIVNTQLAGESMWLWYTKAFHDGVRLYSGLHLALQPLYILESDLWMKMFGVKCIVTEIPSLLHAMLLAAGMFAVLRESTWPDWQKGTVLFSAFALCVSGHNYRFDDYHVTAEALIIWSVVLLLVLARTEEPKRQAALAVALGALAGLTTTSRVTDGVALLTASCYCMVFLAKRRKLPLAGLTLLTAAAVVLSVVQLTGDSFPVYLTSTVIKAAGSKGGTGSIFAALLLVFGNAVQFLFRGRKWLLVFMLGLVAVNAPLKRRWPRLTTAQLMAIQIGMAAVAYAVCSHTMRRALLGGLLIDELVYFSVVAMYLLPIVVAIRFARVHVLGTAWDAREALVFLVLAIWASYSAGAAGEPLTQYYAPISMMLLLAPVLEPFRRQAAWVNASFLSVVALVGLSAVTSKALVPYAWNDAKSSPMFTHRVWYDHPVYGWLYLNRGDLAFFRSICDGIEQQGASRELLSIPYPYPNYFCAIPPWHDYVQTYFDTSTRATILRLIGELKTAPPMWIVYQRQLHIMSGAERLYNHGRPLAQRELDTLIMDNIASGKWQLVEKRDYPKVLDKDEYLPGDGWYVIRTRQ